MSHESHYLLLKRIFLISIFFINAIYGFAQYGVLDNSFGAGGKVTAGVPGDLNFVYSVTIQPDGKILVLGEVIIDTPISSTVSEAVHYIDISRYNGDGSPDISFGNKGTVLTNLSVGSGGASMALQSDGRIVIGGSSFDVGNGDNYNDMVLLRYNKNGQPDNTFGTNGMAVYQSIQTGGVDQVKVLSDGSIIAQGYASGMILMRCDSAGALDGSFGKYGVVYEYDDDAVGTFAMQCDGKILTVSYTYNAGCTLSRYNPDGSLDQSFANNGHALTNFAMARCISIKSDGRIIVAGNSSVSHSYLIEQYLSNGSLDPSFGNGGMAELNFASQEVHYTVTPNAVIIQNDGKILIGGAGNGDNNYAGTNVYYFVMGRLNADGTADATFGSGGIVQNNFGTATALAMQPDGKIVQAGNVQSESNIVLARFTSGVSSGPVDACHYPSYPFTPLPEGLLQIYPNPSAGMVSLRVSLAEPANLYVQVYDMCGKKVVSTEIDMNTGLDIPNIDLMNLASGNYIMHVTLGQQTYLRKLVILSRGIGDY